MPLKILSTLDRSGSVINLTGAISSRLLLPGETAQIAYTNATSVPLNVDTEEGLYELNIVGLSRSYTNNNNTILLPNNTTTAAAAIKRVYESGPTLTNSTDNSFFISTACLFGNTAKISTFTDSKTMMNQMFEAQGAITATYSKRIMDIWDDSTPWTSLGTIQLPFAQSGKIIIRRVV